MDFQVENCNMPYLDVMKQYDDGRDLTDYDFSKDGFGPPCDDLNKRKLAYRHRSIEQKYKKVGILWIIFFFKNPFCCITYDQ